MILVAPSYKPRAAFKTAFKSLFGASKTAKTAYLSISRCPIAVNESHLYRVSGFAWPGLQPFLKLAKQKHEERI